MTNDLRVAEDFLRETFIDGAEESGWDRQEAADEFDILLYRMLALAWEQGSRAGWHDAMAYEASGRGECEWHGMIKNPYEEGAK